jgi:intein/homing endonuclease
VKYGNIQYIEKHRVKKKQYKIKTKNGGSVKVTEDHSLMIMNNNGDLVEKTPKNIKSGDKIVKLL